MISAAPEVTGNGVDHGAPPGGDREPQVPRMHWYPRDFGGTTRGWPLIARTFYEFCESGYR